MSRSSRSAVMTAIESRGNRSTELAMASLLRRAGISGWRRHVAITGSPDFVWRSERVALFVDGCFWHGCPRCYREPRSRVGYWRSKIDRNRRRDAAVTRKLRRQGWRVLRVWECQLKASGTGGRMTNRLLQALGRNRAA